ncbi:MAG TPA: toluene-4-monooxygenase system B family protein [Steroidobacteraceae bacterium]|jgi:toluene monooxygenase system protein B
MAAFPIYGRFVGDFGAVLVSVDTEDTMDEIGAKVAAHVIGRRLPDEPSATGYQVLVDGRVVDASTRLKDLSVSPLHWVDVRWRR